MVVTIELKGVKKVFRSLDKRSSEEVLVFSSVQLSKLLSALKSATPKDTGKASAGWKIDTIPVSVSTLNKDQTYFIINNVEYIGELNMGSSRQAPARFVEQTAAKFGTVVSPTVTIVGG